MTDQEQVALAKHFENRSPNVKATYDAVLASARTFGAVVEEPKKTSIHLVHRTAFAGVATRRDSLILTVKSETDIASDRVLKREQASRNRWHLEIRLSDPREVDTELKDWLRRSFELSAPPTSFSSAP